MAIFKNMKNELFEKIKQKIELLPKQKQEIYDLNKIKEAVDFAYNAHQEQKRKSGEPYIVHPIETALKIIDFNLDNNSVIAGILHDVPEDTSYNLKEIENKFGKDVSFLVNGITKLGKLKYRGNKLRVESLRKMFFAMAEDIRVVLIKLADRCHNMRTLEALAEEKQKRIATETLEIYAPLAYRLGMVQCAGNLEDLAFPYVYPDEFKWLVENMEERRKILEKYLEKITPLVKKRLEENNINVLKIYSRVKHYYSLFKKLQNYDMDFDRIYDLVALRIIVPYEADCYAALGVVHKYWTPLPGKIKDYIAMPKPNGYRSLHTTVFCENNKIVEVQIRTPQMHEQAEKGIAAHWHYENLKSNKKYKKQVAFANKQEVNWVKKIRDLYENLTDSQEFIDSLKVDLFENRIFVLTPKGEAVDLPQGSVPIDFAYAIHSEIGDHCALAKVNGKVVPLDYQLKTGDVVEIITQKNKKPSESWLSFVRTSQAKRKIRASLRKKPLFGFIKKEPLSFEFKIIVSDKPGVLNEVTKIFSEKKINISRVISEDTKKYPVILIQVDLKDEKSARNLMVKLKKIPFVKEVSIKLIK